STSAEASSPSYLLFSDRKFWAFAESQCLFQRIFVGIVAGLLAFSVFAEVARGPRRSFPQNNNPQHPRSINLSTAGRRACSGPILLFEGGSGYEKQVCRSVGFGVRRRLFPVFPNRDC